MQPSSPEEMMSREEIEWTEDMINETVPVIRAKVQAGWTRERVVNLALSMPADYMTREDFQALYVVALWMFAKQDGPVRA